MHLKYKLRNLWIGGHLEDLGMHGKTELKWS